MLEKNKWFDKVGYIDKVKTKNNIKELEKILTNITLSNFHPGTIQSKDYF